MKLILLITCFACCTSLNAQTTEDSVKTVINNMFTAMAKADSAMFMNCFSDSALMQTIAKDATVRSGNPSRFVHEIKKLSKDAADERIQFKTILIDGNLASVWTPYKFYYNGKFSHCGVNSFQLVRINDNWKIQYLIDTRRKENCSED